MEVLQGELCYGMVPNGGMVRNKADRAPIDNFLKRRSEGAAATMDVIL